MIIAEHGVPNKQETADVTNNTIDCQSSTELHIVS